MYCTPLGETIDINDMYEGCIVLKEVHGMKVDLVPLKMYYFDVILKIDWMRKHHTSIGCFTNIINFKVHCVELYNIGEDYKEIDKKWAYYLLGLYRRYWKELIKLKIQLQKLLDKWFIWVNHSY